MLPDDIGCANEEIIEEEEEEVATSRVWRVSGVVSRKKYSIRTALTNSKRDRTFHLF